MASRSAEVISPSLIAWVNICWTAGLCRSAHGTLIKGLVVEIGPRSAVAWCWYLRQYERVFSPSVVGSLGKVSIGAVLRPELAELPQFGPKGPGLGELL